MADNYIERQQELYEARKVAWKHSKKNLHRQNKEQTPQRRVLVVGGADATGRALVKGFCEAGHRVAFCDNDEKGGRLTAVLTGADFECLKRTDVRGLNSWMETWLEDWGDVDVLVINAAAVGNGTERMHYLEVVAEGVTPAIELMNQWEKHRRNRPEDLKEGCMVMVCPTPDNDDRTNRMATTATQGALTDLTLEGANALKGVRIAVNAVKGNTAGEPEKVARMCLFLTDEKCNCMNGEVISLI